MINHARDIQRNLLFFGVSMLLICCSYQSPTSPPSSVTEALNVQQDGGATAASGTLVGTTPTSPDSEHCQRSFAARELREPYQRYDGDNPRYTLSGEELETYFELMGIRSICIPTQFGAPFLNVDWDERDLPATGRMVSIGFEELYAGGGWSKGYLLYSTYDFSVGSEYEVFASPSDFDLVQSESISDPLDADGVRGFVRYHPGIPMGMQTIMKTYIFPFENYYVAVVINLGAYDPADIEKVLQEMEAGSHPDLVNEDSAAMDLMVSSIHFH